MIVPSINFSHHMLSVDQSINRDEVTYYEFQNSKKHSFRVIKDKVLGHGVSGTVYKVIEYKEKLGENLLPVSKKPRLSLMGESGKFFAMKEYLEEDEITEFKIGRELNHSHIVQILNYTECLSVIDPIEGQRKVSYMLMEFIDGQSLDERLKNVISRKEFYQWISQLLNAVDYCLQKELIPVDIKPANIMIDQASNLKLIDVQSYCTFESFQDKEVELEDLIYPDFCSHPDITNVIYAMIGKCPTLKESDVVSLPNCMDEENIVEGFKAYINDLKQWLAECPISQELTFQDITREKISALQILKNQIENLSYCS